jgi:hypothetical protein
MNEIITHRVLNKIKEAAIAYKSQLAHRSEAVWLLEEVFPEATKATIEMALDEVYGNEAVEFKKALGAL